MINTSKTVQADIYIDVYVLKNVYMYKDQNETILKLVQSEILEF